MEKIYDLRGMLTPELERLVVELGCPAFRGRQIANRIFKHSAASIEDIHEIPAALRSRLAECARLDDLKPLRRDASDDGTEKFLLGLNDDETIEAVLLPYEDRVSTCISTQVGCAAGCAFCATGIGGFRRNLTAGEMVGEVIALQQNSERRISHVVYMGMGEPLLNFQEVLKSVRILNSELGIAMRHITLSTVGIVPGIDRLAAEDLQLTLAISLHAPNDDLRCKLIPMAKRFPILDLMDACKRYAETTGRRVTYEYLLIRGVNDSTETARELGALLRKSLCAVNLIPFNSVDGLAFRRPESQTVREFASVLKDMGISVTQRMERGRSISAACGQLRRRNAED